MRLYLIRHPRPDVAEGICYGQTDLPLAEPAIEVAARLRPQLPAGLPVYSSPLRRCLELAVELHPRPRFDERLREMHFGAWEMQAWDDIGRAALDAWAADPLHFVAPGSESVARMRERALEFVATLDGDAVLVTHAGVIRALTGWAEALPQEVWIRRSFPYASITVQEWDADPRR